MEKITIEGLITIEELENKKEFHSMFEITRNIIIEVSFYTLGNNKDAKFTTTANDLNRPKTDYKQSGQAQESLLPKGSPARKFYKKWDNLHFSDLKEEEYNDMIKDLKELTIRYNSEIYDNSIRYIEFYEVVKFSKQPLKTKSKLIKKSNNMK